MLTPIIVKDKCVPNPSQQNDSLLRRLLTRWAAHFTSDVQIQAHLVDRTISEILVEFPTADDASPIDVELFATMRRVLIRDFGVQPRAMDRPQADEPAPIDD